MKEEDKFWEFVDRVNFTSNIYNEIFIDFDDIMLSMAKFYSIEDLKLFDYIYQTKYHESYNRFKKLWLSEGEPLGVSDDGYTDLISSVVGLGKNFYYSITDEGLINMANDNYYRENFGYLFHSLDRDKFIEKYNKQRRIHKLESL